MHLVRAPVLESWTVLSDEQVVSRVLGGQTALFEVLMRRHNERLYRAARAILRDDHEAEDVMQQAYVNAYSHLRQFDGRSQFSTWLTRIAVHEALARVRRRSRYRTMDPENPSTLEFPAPAAPVPDPERLAFSRELGALLESAIDRLPDGAREVFVLRQVEGMSTEEAAEALGVTEAVVKTRLSRARRALRRDLYQHAGIVASNAFRFLRPRCDRVVAAVLARIL
ncbi:MAG TPA: RNA polymerase sigma factor [Vicinamibacterales bacterium]|nr:RNA polymerase sigma factor [Vicinamibacterales bacterium]